MSSIERYGECFHFDNTFWNAPLKYGSIDLYQIGEMCGECGYEMGSHLQACNEISYIVSGSGYAYVEDERILNQAGDILVCTTGHYHKMCADSYNMLRFLYMGFMFNSSAAQKQWGEMVEFYDGRPYSLIKDANSVLIPFTRSLDEFFTKKKYAQKMIKDYVEQILILTYRSAAGEVEQVLSLPRAENTVGDTVYAIIRYIENNIFDIDDIRTIASSLGYSYSYISHLFKERTGVTLQRYIGLKKHEKALELLKYGNLSVTQVASQLKYKSVQAFSKAFSRTMGFPPSKHMRADQPMGELPAAERQDPVPDILPVRPTTEFASERKA